MLFEWINKHKEIWGFKFLAEGCVSFLCTPAGVYIRVHLGAFEIILLHGLVLRTSVIHVFNTPRYLSPCQDQSLRKGYE